jgi:cation:H+ antiporter
MTLLMTLGGALLLMVAGDALVRGAIGLSLKFGLSATLISLTVVALGTSAPELVISVEAALNGSPDIALGNVVGSNIANTLLIVGVPAVIVVMSVATPELRRSYVLMLIATALFTAFAMTGQIGRTAGIIMLATLVAIIIYSYKKSNAEVELEDADDRMPSWKMAGLLIAGVIGLPIGAH